MLFGKMVNIEICHFVCNAMTQFAILIASPFVVGSWIPVIWQIFINNVRENLHWSIATSAPARDAIRFDLKANSRENVEERKVLSYAFYIWNKAMIAYRER